MKNVVFPTGGRQADDIVAWLKKKTGPPAVEIASAEQAKELIAANTVIVFGFFPDQTTDKAKSFLNVAEQVDDQVFAIVSSEEVTKELEAQAEDVVLYKNVSNIITHFVHTYFILSMISFIRQMGKLHTSIIFKAKTWNYLRT